MSPPTHIAAPLSLPNQEILQPPPPSHHLSASDDLITRFHLHDSYRILLHPFRKDLHHQPRDTTTTTIKAEAGPSTPTRTTSGEGTGGPRDTQQHQQSYTLPKTFAHYLPPSLPGKVRPPKPPRKNQILARRAAAQALEGGGQQLGGGGEQQGGGPDSSGSVSGSSAERKLARQHAEWEKASSTLRRVVYKAEYSGPSEMRTWGEGEEGMRGFLGLEAGDVDEIDRSLLEADAPTGSTPPRKKKRKGQHGNQQQQ